MDMLDHDGAGSAGKRREERMRYEVLGMVCRAARRDPNEAVSCAPLSASVGVWREEIFRVLEFLDDNGLLRYCGPGPEVCITPRGIEYLYGEGRHHKSIPDQD